MLDLMAYVILPVYTVLFAHGYNWITENFTVLANWFDRKAAFVGWALLVGIYFAVTLGRLIQWLRAGRWAKVAGVGFGIIGSGGLPAVFAKGISQRSRTACGLFFFDSDFALGAAAMDNRSILLFAQRRMDSILWGVGSHLPIGCDIGAIHRSCIQLGGSVFLHCHSAL